MHTINNNNKKTVPFTLSPNYDSGNVQLLWSCCSIFEVKRKNMLLEKEDKMKTDNGKKFDLIIQA